MNGIVILGFFRRLQQRRRTLRRSVDLDYLTCLRGLIHQTFAFRTSHVAFLVERETGM